MAAKELNKSASSITSDGYRSVKSFKFVFKNRNSFIAYEAIPENANGANLSRSQLSSRKDGSQYTQSTNEHTYSRPVLTDDSATVCRTISHIASAESSDFEPRDGRETPTTSTRPHQPCQPSSSTVQGNDSCEKGAMLKRPIKDEGAGCAEQPANVISIDSPLNMIEPSRSHTQWTETSGYEEADDVRSSSSSSVEVPPKRLRASYEDPVALGYIIMRSETRAQIEDVLKAHIGSYTYTAPDLMAMRAQVEQLHKKVDVILTNPNLPRILKGAWKAMKDLSASMLGSCAVNEHNCRHAFDAACKNDFRIARLVKPSKIEKYKFDARRITNEYIVRMRELGDKTYSLRAVLAAYARVGGKVVNASVSELIVPFVRFVYQQLYGADYAKYAVCTGQSPGYTKLPQAVNLILLDMLLCGFGVSTDSLQQSDDQEELKQAVFDRINNYGRRFL
ncbi:hypothetical protein Tcan_16161 [Toxocara canis]|uniref:Uncharacterized protein n=2 Tax=Toxocara canis TaxID=6265 RepID=A0A0B2VUE2_TOXCA|nr:hypothetical protein Tcan_16161 [Toxocara canis]VDM38574.1 unnamed protein product [Toxocara canis]